MFGGKGMREPERSPLRVQQLRGGPRVVFRSKNLGAKGFTVFKSMRNGAKIVPLINKSMRIACGQHGRNGGDGPFA